MSFKLHSIFQPAGDQPEAIEQLVHGLHHQEKYQVLLGVTGSGKTFTMANVIERVQRPVLVLAYNKTLVAQLYGEFKQFFPNNCVEYFVSYYDYYQPEAYMPTADKYIEKDLSINEEIDKLRLRATSHLLSGRRDIIVVASVSCIYGMGNPAEFQKGIIRISVGQKITRNAFLRELVASLYQRSFATFERAQFRVQGDAISINLPYADYALRVIFFGDEIESIESYDKETGKAIETLEDAAIFPANLYLAPRDKIKQIIADIEDEMMAQVNYFKQAKRPAEAQRIYERTSHDIEMIRELGYCSGIENYSRFFDFREKGTRPFCLIDYFPEDFICVIDESHQTIPQISGMYGGDRSRKMNLVDYGFRLPSALDNRPLNFHEFENHIGQTIFVSATPGDFELTKTEGLVVEQVVRPTGLLDPPIEVRKTANQIDDLIGEIEKRIKSNERVLVTTLTKRMAEELDKYLQKLNILTAYIHSDVDTLDRMEIIRKLRLGDVHVLIGVNLLREGLDLPEVSLVAVLDADKEGFLRNERSLTQTAGRAARNINGLVIFYADNMTQSMQKTIDETQRRRDKQIVYNQKHHIIPKTVSKSKQEILAQTSVLDIRTKDDNKIEPVSTEEYFAKVAEQTEQYFSSPKELEKLILVFKESMKKAAKNLDFIEAARLRDYIKILEKKSKE